MVSIDETDCELPAGLLQLRLGRTPLIWVEHLPRPRWLDNYPTSSSEARSNTKSGSTGSSELNKSVKLVIVTENDDMT
jgi:hypothetical protein